jgi:hypothetical protein
MLALLVAVSLAARVSAQQPSDSLRLIVATGSTCHSRPDPGSPVAERYHLGDVVGASKSTRGLGGRIWYFDSWRVKGTSPTCWVPANLTVAFDRAHPESGFAAVAERVVAGDSASIEMLTEAENLLVEPNPFDAGIGQSPIATSGLLQFRRLMLVERASRLVTAFSVQDAPLQRSWILAHRDVLAFAEPDAMWFVPNEHYWKIYDANVGAPWAEELAWHAAQRTPPGDECGADCFLGMIAYGPQQYWARLPNGRSIGKVLTLATKLADEAIAGIDEEPPTRPAIDSVRTSLANVRSPAKQALLDRLVRLDRAVKP